MPTWALVRAARRVERMLVDLFAAHGLTPVQFGVLVYLGTGTDFTQSQLARLMLIRPQSVSTVIAEMVDRGLLARAGRGGRGRPTPIRLTPTGLELLRSIVPTVRWANEPERLGLDTRQAARLTELLREVLHSELTTEGKVDVRARRAGVATRRRP